MTFATHVPIGKSAPRLAQDVRHGIGPEPRCSPLRMLRPNALF
jgi:hypothetical protein